MRQCFLEQYELLALKIWGWGVVRVERELTRWQPDSSVLDPSLTLTASTFGRPNSGSVIGWDQFETNRQKFQVRSPAQRTCMNTCAGLYLVANIRRIWKRQEWHARSVPV